MKVTDIFTTQRGINCLHNAGLRYADMGSALTVDTDQPFSLIIFNHIVGINDIGCRFKYCAQLFCRCYLAFVIGAINFSDNGRHYRWSWRYLNDFYIGIHFLANGLQRCAD